MMIVNIPGSGSLTCASRVAPPKVNWAAPSAKVNSTSIICPSISSSIFIGVVLVWRSKGERRNTRKRGEDRGMKNEDRLVCGAAIFDFQSSLLDPRSSFAGLGVLLLSLYTTRH